MAMHGDVDPTLSTKDLDAFTWTHYPVHGDVFPENGPLGFRLGSGAMQSFMHDFMRPINGISGLMELQPGQVNWGAINPWPQPGAIHMWILRAFGAGARMVCTYRYRQPLFGNEQYHKGLVETDGVTPSPGGREYAEAMRDVISLRAKYRSDAKEPAAYAKRRTAFLINFDNRWDIDIHKQTTRWDTVEHWMKYYRALKSMMAPVDVVTEDRDLSRYPFVVAPAYQLVDDALIAKWTAYAENGGNLVLTARSGQKDRRGHFPETLWVERLYGLIGAKLPIYDVLPGTIEGHVTADGARLCVGILGRHAGAASGHDDAGHVRRPVLCRQSGGGDAQARQRHGDLHRRGYAERRSRTRAAAQAVRQRGRGSGEFEAGLPGGLARRLLGGDQLHVHAASDSSTRGNAVAAGNASVPPGGVAVWIE